jgi:predicted transcriptional regulator of viral defense system
MALPKIYKDFYNQKVFSSQELRERYKKTNTLGSIRILLHNCKKSGYVGSVKRGLYYIIPQESSKKNYIVDKYLIASKLSPTAVIAYHSALELHGVAQSAFNRVFILTQQRIQQSKFQGTTFVPIQGNLSFGKTTIIRENVSIRVADRERTLIDGIDRLKYAGGLEEYLKSIESFPSVNFERIEEYLKKYNKVSLYAKVGFVLSLFKKRWALPEDVRRRLRSNIKAKVYYLAQMKAESVFDKECNLMVPKKIQALIQGA